MQNPLGKMVGDVANCTPNPWDVCEDLHDDEVDVGDEWEIEVIVRKKKVRAMAVQYHLILLRVGLGKKLWHWWVSVA